MPDTATDRLLTVEEFLAHYPPPSDQRRWQLIHGRPVPMNPTMRRHRFLAGFFRDALNARLTPPCAAETEACIRPLVPRKPHSYWLADVATSCVPVGPGTDTPDPVLIAEFVSDNEGEDRKAKLQDYRELPTVQAYLLFDQEPRVEIHQRRADGFWPAAPEVVQGIDGVLVLRCHGGLTIPLREIYQV
jgi:Uma2 family endonuclease